MGLLQALNNAVSGLNVNQQTLNVLSNNITNANTPNYSKQTANPQAIYLSGADAGASIAGITRSVNEFLTAQVQTQTTVNSGNSTLTDYYNQIQNLLGQPGGNNSIDSAISSFFVAMQNLANTPSSVTQANAVTAATTMAGQVSSLATGLQNLRLQADTDLTNSVSNINSDLLNLYKNNVAIEQASATSQNTNGLMDQRDALIADLSQYMNVTPVTQSDGTVNINSAGGITLVTGTTYSQLNHASASSVQSLIDNNTVSPITVTTIDANGNTLGNSITLATGGASSSVTTPLTGGKLQALIQMRDGIIPNILTQLDQLAGTLRDNFNAISNEGSGFPPPNSYTGTTLLSGSSTSTYSGNVRIAILNGNGTPVPSPYPDEGNGMQPLTLNLGALNNGQGAGVSSVDQIINAINQYYGPQQNKAELGSLNNVQLNVASNSVPDNNGNLSFNFNLNNISADNANFYVGGYNVYNSTGTLVASSVPGAAPNAVTSAQPGLAISTYTFDGTDNNVTLTTTGTNTVNAGDVVYLNQPSGATVDGIPSSSLSGFYVVNSVNGNQFTVTIPGASAGGAGSFAAGITAFTKDAAVASGQTVNTGASGNVTAAVGSSSTPYYTVQATIATLDANGNLVQSVVTYRVPNNSSNSVNDVIGATSANGAGTLVQPTTSSIQPILTATLVDANGNPLSKINGVYGNQQGYLKITANNNTYTVAIDEMDSQQQGYSGFNGVSSTGEGFSQYFGLNNFFTPPATAGNLTNSAVNLSVSSNLVSNPGLITTGTLSLGPQSNAPGAVPNYTYQVSSGDNSISQKLAGLATNSTSFPAAAGLPSSSSTFAQYAGNIIAATSTNASDATNAQKDSQALLNGFTQSAQQVSGVNLDQELANTVTYQNAYAASARVISVVATMFNELINSIGQ